LDAEYILYLILKGCHTEFTSLKGKQAKNQLFKLPSKEIRKRTPYKIKPDET
jgi:hypothetical protein